jgi:hypothetical protein
VSKLVFRKILGVRLGGTAGLRRDGEEEETMKSAKWLVFLLAALLPAAGMLMAQTSENPYAKYLTVADVEQISGIAGITAVGRNPMKGFGGDLNFAKGDDKMVVTAKFYDANWYAGNKRDKENIKAMVSDIGDEAYIGPGFMDPQYTLTFLKGQQCVFLSTALVPGDPITTVLTLDQLKEIGKLVASRL